MFNRKAKKSRLVLLIEHLDAIAYAIEKLEERKFDRAAPEADASADDILDYQNALRLFVENIRARELSLIAHVDRARIRADKIAGYDAAIRAYARLFIGGTQAFADQLMSLAQPMMSDFDGNDQVLNFLKTRRLVATDCLSTEATDAISFDGDYRIAGLVPVSVLAEQCAAFLNLVEDHELLSDGTGADISAVGYLRQLDDRETENSLSA